MEQYKDMGLQYFDEKLQPDIEKENFRQIVKWGNQTHSMFEWCNYLTEELGELAKAIAEHEYRDGEAKDIYDEAIQVATLSIKIAMMIRDKKIFKGNKD